MKFNMLLIAFFVCLVGHSLLQVGHFFLHFFRNIMGILDQITKKLHFPSD